MYLYNTAIKDNDNVEVASSASEEDFKKFKEKAFSIKKQLRNDTENFDVSFKKTNDKHSYVFRYKDENNNYNGNKVYITLDSNGELVSASIHSEDNTNVKNEIKVSEKQAEDIFMDYIKQHSVLKDYADKISKNEYKIERDVYETKNVWTISMKVPNSPFGNYKFIYLIDTETGSINYKSEPMLLGFLTEFQICFLLGYT